jgi:hypothetical protein
MQNLILKNCAAFIQKNANKEIWEKLQNAEKIGYF